MYQDDDSLEKTKKGLYSRKGEDRRGERVTTSVNSKNTDQKKTPPKNWKYEQTQNKEKSVIKSRIIAKKPGGTNTFVRSLLIISVIFFVLALGLVAYKFFFSGSSLSSRKVQVNISAPTTARAGDELNLDVSILNTNSTQLVNPKISLLFPENTLAPDESGEKVDNISREINNIAPGENITEEFEVFLFGERDEDIEIQIILEYSSDTSTTKLSNQETHTVKITSSPISLVIKPTVREVQSGDLFDINIDVSSNTNADLDSVLVEADYPDGFTFVSSDPSPTEGEAIWSLGDLSPQESESISVRGFVEGQNNEDRFFSFRTGVQSLAGNSIGRLYAAAQDSVTITLPPISLRTNTNGSGSAIVPVSAGSKVSVRVAWANSLNNPLNNMQIEAFLDSPYIEEGSISVDGGFYQSTDNTIVWNQSTDSSLGLVGEKAQGTVSFSFTTVSEADLRGVVNPEFPIVISARASEPQSSGTQRNISNRIERTMRVASDLSLAQILKYERGPFSNSGPVPPKAESKTTYTVTWSVSNAGNGATGTTVRAELPTYVNFVQAEEGSSVRYSPLSNEVVWNIGDLPENTGNKSASFQISLTPSISQVGVTPTLIGQALVQARDSFTGNVLPSYARPLNTGDLAETGAGAVVE